MSNLDDFKNIADDVLKDIKVSEGLREKTIKRCSVKASERKLVISGAIAAALIIAILNPSSMIGGKISGLKPQNNSIMMETEGSQSTKRAIDKPLSQNPDDPVSSGGDIQGKTEGGSGSVQGSETLSGAPIYRAGSIEEAKNYMGKDFRSPSYIPKGYEMELVQVPVDMGNMGMDITLGYRYDKRLFSVIMKKGPEGNEFFKGDKVVEINGVTAQITSGKLYAGDEIVEGEYTRLQWVYREVIYSIEGQISETEAIKVAKSIK